MTKKNILIIPISILLVLSLVSCKKKQETKPFGAVDIDYEAVEKINSNGPSLEMDNVNNAPPMAEKTTKEAGPWATEYEGDRFPYMEGDGTISEDDVPIHVEEHN